MQQIQTIKLTNGQDILKGLTDALDTMRIRNGVIVCGIGSSASAHVHVVKSTALPPGNEFFEERGPFDIVSMQGYLMEGRVHAHIALARGNDGSLIGGHLEPGCRVLTFCIVSVIATEALGDMDTYPEQRK